MADETEGDPKETEAVGGEEESIGGAVAAAEAGDDISGGAVYDVPVEIQAVLGRAQIQVAQLLKMGRGAVMELDRLVGDPVDIYVNKQLVARAEVTVVEDKLGVTLTEVFRLR